MHYYCPLSVLSVLATGLLCALATPLQPYWGGAPMRVKHEWSAIPRNWECLGPPAVETTIDLHIALKAQHEDALIDTLYEVSTPSGPRYGGHLSMGQASELVAPHQDTLEQVYSWLEHHVSVYKANVLLGASYQFYQHAETKDRVLRTLSYALPAVLHECVKTITPTTYFGSPRTPPRKHSSGEVAPRSASEMLSSRDDDYVDPSYLQWLYNTEGYVPAATDRNVIGITGYLGDYPSQDDLTEFMDTFVSDAVDATITVVQVGDGDLPAEPHAEANIDVQYAEAIAYPTPSIYYTTLGDEPFLRWLNYILSQPKVPQTISTSYSGNENDFPEDHAIELCKLFAVLGARGVSVLFSSGNQGVGPQSREDCKDASGSVKFVPTFPPSCPYITSVGGTFDHSPEIAAPYSSGGFSNYFARPKYQDIAVSGYFKTLGNLNQGLYNATNRGFPDMAAQSDDFEYILDGESALFWGTSCSVPTVAGVISLLNDYQLSKGLHPLGWLNPLLYGRGHAGLNDITSGSNPGCGTRGFPATDGWDPVTGLGSPNFRYLQHILDGR